MEESESETSSSSGSSSSSSCSDSGSSSDSESSSSVAAAVEEKSVTTPSNTKSITNNQRQRRSSEIKATTTQTKTTSTSAGAENVQPPSVPTTSNTLSSSKQKNNTTHMSAASKVRAVASQRNVSALSSESDDDDEENVPSPKKSCPAKRKVSNASASKPSSSNVRNTAAAKTKAAGNTRNATENGGDRKNAAGDSSTIESDDSIKESKRKVPPKMTATNSNVRGKQLRKKLPPKQTTLTKASQAVAAQRNNSKSSESSESGSDSGSGSGDESSSASDSEDSDSTNSYSSQPNNSKNTKQRRNGGGGGGGAVVGGTSSAGGVGPKQAQPRSGSDDNNVKAKPHPMRKLTRSLSMRRTKQQLKQQGSDTDTDAELENRACLTKSPTKKPATSFNNITASKCKVKKESGNSFMQIKTRPISPLAQLEKKCPIEGCDSSGHLSGNLDRHFLPEACPIYHNMSASECKERANERKLRGEQRLKSHVNQNPTGNGPTAIRTLTTEQKEFLAKIRESRASFQPIKNSTIDKVKLEKDCSDEDREPNLSGLVPDYDLQLFREAQALASEKIEDELKDLPVGKGIKYITMGKYKMKVWYQSPYPEDAARLPKMYICEFCLRYQKSETGIKRHAQKCVWRHPPGDEIYRKGKLQVWQVDGKRYKQYCQHLCLLAKFFLDHKTLYYDVEPFLFYIMTLADVDGCHIVGYFSKEKNSFYNVSCILTLPPYQRKGYGRLLIDFSYLLTRVEGKIGSPEKPLSDLGLISYRSYWKDVLLDYLCNRTGNTLSIKDVSQEMAIYSYDIVSTLQWLGMMKYWKGKHIVLKKQDVLDEYEERVKRRGTFPKIDDSCLRWQPFVPVQTNSTP